MNSKNTDDRLSEWLALRKNVELADEPFDVVAEFWRDTPFVPYNRHIDPYNRPSWPTPWEILADNVYDDFTRALMMAYSIKYTHRFAQSNVEVRTYFNESRTQMFNIVYIDDTIVLNYRDGEAVKASTVPATLCLDNAVTIN